MFREDHAHHERDQIVGYLRDALAIVAELELEDDLKVPAFLKAVDLLAAKQVFFRETPVARMGALDLPPRG